MTAPTCPYCSAEMPLPAARATHLHIECPACHAKPLAKFTDTADGRVLVSYVRDGRPGPALVVVSLRLDKETAAEFRSLSVEGKRRAVRLGLDILRG